MAYLHSASNPYLAGMVDPVLEVLILKFAVVALTVFKHIIRPSKVNNFLNSNYIFCTFYSKLLLSVAFWLAYSPVGTWANSKNCQQCCTVKGNLIMASVTPISFIRVCRWLGRVHTGEVIQWISIQLHL